MSESGRARRSAATSAETRSSRSRVSGDSDGVEALGEEFLSVVGAGLVGAQGRELRSDRAETFRQELLSVVGAGLVGAQGRELRADRAETIRQELLRLVGCCLIGADSGKFGG